MGDGDAQDLPLPGPAGEAGPRVLDPDRDVPAEELEVLVAEHGPGQQAELEQDLEAVADAQDEPALGRRTRGLRCISGEKRAMAPARR